MERLPDVVKKKLSSSATNWLMKSMSFSWGTKSVSFAKADGSSTPFSLSKPSGDLWHGHSPMQVMQWAGGGFFVVAVKSFYWLDGCLAWSEWGLVYPLFLLFFLSCLAAAASFSYEGVAGQIDVIAKKNEEYGRLNQKLGEQIESLGGVQARLQEVQSNFSGGVEELDSLLDSMDRLATVDEMCAVLDAFAFEDDYGDSNRELRAEELTSFLEGPAKNVLEQELPAADLAEFGKLAQEKNYSISLDYLMLMMNTMCVEDHSEEKAKSLLLLLLFAVEPESEERMTDVLSFLGPALSAVGGRFASGGLQRELQTLANGATQPGAGASAPAAAGQGAAEPLLATAASAAAASGTVPVRKLCPIAKMVLTLKDWPSGPKKRGIVSRGIGMTLLQDGMPPSNVQARSITIAPPAVASRDIELGPGGPVVGVPAGMDKTIEHAELAAKEAARHAKDVRGQVMVKVKNAKVSMFRFLTSEGLYDYPTLYLPLATLLAEVVLFFAYFANPSFGRFFWSISICGPLLFTTALYLFLNPDLVITMIRLQLQLGQFEANNKALKKTLGTQEGALKDLRKVQNAFTQLDKRFQGGLDELLQNRDRLKRDAEANIKRQAMKLVKMYCDKDRDSKVTKEEFTPALELMACLFGGVFPDMIQREDAFQAGIKDATQRGFNMDKGMDVLDFSAIMGDIVLSEDDYDKIADLVEAKLCKGLPPPAAAPALPASAVASRGFHLPGMGSQSMKTTEQRPQSVEELLGHRVKIVVLGSTSFNYEHSEAICAGLAQALDQRLGRQVTFITGGMTGVQKTFAYNCVNATHLLHLVSVDKPSGFDVGQDVIVANNLEERREVMGSVGQVYICIEGGPGVAMEAKGAYDQGAFIVPVPRTGGASDGRFEAFPRAALEKPFFATQEDWDLLGSGSVPPEVTAQAAAKIVEAAARWKSSHGVAQRVDAIHADVSTLHEDLHPRLSSMAA